MAGVIEFDLQSADWLRTLQRMETKMPNIGRALIRKVNSEVVKQVRREARARGYKAHDMRAFGDAGFQKNIFAYANSDLTGKIMIGRNAYQYRFIEYGANVKPRNKKVLTFVNEKGKFRKSEGFILSPSPLLTPIAERIWKSQSSEIMEKEMQRLIKKLEEKGIIK